MNMMLPVASKAAETGPSTERSAKPESREAQDKFEDCLSTEESAQTSVESKSEKSTSPQESRTAEEKGEVTKQEEQQDSAETEAAIAAPQAEVQTETQPASTTTPDIEGAKVPTSSTEVEISSQEASSEKGKTGKVTETYSNRQALVAETKNEDQILKDLLASIAEDFSPVTEGEGLTNKEISQALQNGTTLASIEAMANASQESLSNSFQANGLEAIAAPSSSAQSTGGQGNSQPSTEVMPKAALQEVPEVVKNLDLQATNLPKRIEIPLTTPKGAHVQLYLQENNGSIRAQISTNDKGALDYLNRELAHLRNTTTGQPGAESQNVKWLPAQLESSAQQNQQYNLGREQQSQQQQQNSSSQPDEQESEAFEQLFSSSAEQTQQKEALV